MAVSRLPVGSSARMTARIVSQRAGDGHTLLFASGEMTAGLRNLSPKPTASSKPAARSRISPSESRPKLAHRDHHVLLRGEILHQKMELKNEADELAPFVRQLVIAQLRTLAPDSIETRPASGRSSRPRM